MKIDLKDTAIVFRIHVGILRDGSVFLECDTVENVLGDVPHKNCLSTIAKAGVVLVENAIAFHEGNDGIREERPASVENSDDLSFFEREIDIDG